MLPVAGPRSERWSWCTTIYYSEPGCLSAQPFQSITWSSRIVGKDGDFRGKHTLHFLEWREMQVKPREQQLLWLLEAGTLAFPLIKLCPFLKPTTRLFLPSHPQLPS